MASFIDKPQDVRPGEELDTGKLEPFLRSRFPSELPGLKVQQFPSGHSNLTYAVQLGQKRFVLRRPPFGSKVKSAHDMGREFRVLSNLHSAYPPAPRVLAYCDDPSVLGAPFYVMEPVDGIIVRRDPPPDLPFHASTARRLCESFLDNLVCLHELDYVSIGLEGLGKPEGYMNRQVRGWIERYRGSQTHDYPEIELLSQWLPSQPPTPGPATLVHNDYKFDNVVLDATDITKIVGVLDWEMCTIGDPLSDFGGALAYWIEPGDPDDLQKLRWGPTNYPGSLTRRELVERYARKTERDVSNMIFYLAFALFKVAVIVQQIYYRFHIGLTKDQRFATMPEKVHTLLRASYRTVQTGRL